LFETVKQNYLHNSRIERLINPAKSFPIEQSYINLSVVTSQEQYKRERELRSAVYSDSILSSYEEIYGTKSPIDIQNIFQPCEKETKQVLVFGRAGIGKSTFCRYVTYQWAKGTCWSQYELLALIPLRRLTANRYPPLAPGQNYSLIDLVKKEVFSYELSEKEKILFEKQFDAQNILWILDGYDEIIQNVPENLEELLEKLLQTPHHIITSRPYLNTLSYRVQMEITGFTDENIVQYIQQFFDQMKDELNDATIKNQTLTKFLKSNPSIWGIAHIPVNLELIYSLCSNQDWSETEQLSITALYNKITEWLCRRYLKTSNDKILQLSEDQLYRCCESELKFLEKLAFAAMKNNTIIIRPSLLKNTLRDANVITQDHPDILNIGILKSFTKEGVGTQIEMNKEYYFVHLSFQEYFSARYLTNSLKESSAENTVDFIRYYKYNRRYALVFTFMAGLLNENDEMTSLNTFWDHILQEPLDLVGLRHIELIIICLGETSSDSNFPRRNDFLLLVAVYMQHNLLVKNQIALQHLAQTLRKAPFVICEDIMINTLTALLQSNEIDVKTEVLIFICSMNISNVPDRLINSISALLSDNSDQVKTYACDTIGIIGEKAATFEVLNRLVGLLEDEKDNVRRSACYSLGRLGEKVATTEFISKLINILENKNYNIRSNAFFILNNIPENVITTEIINILVNALYAENECVRCNAYQFLIKITDKLATTEMINKLMNLLEDRREDVIQNVCTLLSNIGEKAGIYDVINQLVTKALTHKSFQIRVLACSTLK
jgi:HEAT repeat protein